WPHPKCRSSRGQAGGIGANLPSEGIPMVSSISPAHYLHRAPSARKCRPIMTRASIALPSTPEMGPWPPFFCAQFDEWTDVFGSERLTGALLDRLTHHVHILEMNGDGNRLAHLMRRKRSGLSDATHQE